MLQRADANRNGLAVLEVGESDDSLVAWVVITGTNNDAAVEQLCNLPSRSTASVLPKGIASVSTRRARGKRHVQAAPKFSDVRAMVFGKNGGKGAARVDF